MPPNRRSASTDAYDWVVGPDVLGVGTFALGELFTTNPYVSGAAYLSRLSDDCGACAFDPERDCPLTRLDWAYLEHHRASLEKTLASRCGIVREMGAGATMAVESDRERFGACLLGWYAALGLDRREAAELACQVLVEAYLAEAHGDSGAKGGTWAERLMTLAEQGFEDWCRERRRRRGQSPGPRPQGDLLADLERLPLRLAAPLFLTHAGGARPAEAAAFLGMEEATLAELSDEGLAALRAARGETARGAAALDGDALWAALAPRRADPAALEREVRARLAYERDDPAHSPSRWVSAIADLLPTRDLRIEILGPFVPAGAAPSRSARLALAALAPLCAHLGLAARIGGPRSDRPDALPSEGTVAAALFAPRPLGGFTLSAVHFFYWVLSGPLALSLLAASAWFPVLARRTRSVGRALPLGGNLAVLLLGMALVTHLVGPTFLGPRLGVILPALWSLGALLCAGIALRGPRAPGSVSPAWIAALAALVCGGTFPLALQVPTDRGRLASFVADFDPLRDGDHGGEWALVAAELARDGGPLPEVGALAARLLDAQAPPDPPVLVRALRLGLFAEADLAALDEPERIARLAEGQGPIPALELEAPAILAHAARAPHGESQRGRLVQRIAASLRDGELAFSLARAALVVELLEALGASDAVGDLAADLRTTLAIHWRGSLHDHPLAAFASPAQPSVFEGSAQGAAYVRPTAEALAVAERVGLPPGVEAWRVRLFLERHARGRHLTFVRGETQTLAAATLRTLERIAPESALPTRERVRLLRSLVPAVLLVAASLLLGARALGQKSPSTRSATMR